MDLAALDTILAHPLTNLLVTVGAAAFVGPVVWLVTGALGVDDAAVPGLRSWRWSRVAGALAGLFALAALAAVRFPGMTDVTVVAAEVVARVAMACTCLFVAAWVVRVRGALATDRAAEAEVARTAGHVWLVAGVLAGVAMVDSGPAFLAAFGVGLFAARNVVSRGEPALRVRAWLLDVAAGITLRERRAAWELVHVGGVRVLAAPGLVTTEVDGGGGRRPMANTQLLALVEGAPEGAGAEGERRSG